MKTRHASLRRSISDNIYLRYTTVFPLDTLRCCLFWTLLPAGPSELQQQRNQGNLESNPKKGSCHLLLQPSFISYICLVCMHHSDQRHGLMRSASLTPGHTDSRCIYTEVLLCFPFTLKSPQLTRVFDSIFLLFYNSINRELFHSLEIQLKSLEKYLV